MGKPSKGTLADINATLRGLAASHPSDDVRAGATDGEIRRIAFHIGLIAAELGTAITVADIGGGIGLFSLGCAALGMKTFLVDDFRDPVNDRLGNDVLDYHRTLGVEIVTRDVIADGLPFERGSFDAITSFDSMEHWHASPKQLFAQVREVLRPGGTFLLGVPNCVNLRKRISVPFGRGKWSAMRDWYEPKTFRGHVREPDVDDLHYIANDMALKNVRIIGRNWLGYGARIPLASVIAPLVDVPLRLRPSLCSDIYLLGTT
jgi:SAM-dependent methyltransferase